MVYLETTNIFSHFNKKEKSKNKSFILYYLDAFLASDSYKILPF